MNAGVARCLLWVALLFVAGPATAVEFPGPAPGPATRRDADGGVRLQNAVLALRCVAATADAAGALGWQNLLAQEETLASALPPCELRLAGSPLPVKWLPAGPLVVERRGGRDGGWSAAQPFAAADGGLTLRWELTLEDGANYARQSLALTPARDVAPESLLVARWTPARPLEASVGGVDGSPIAAGGFFIGCEHPLADNRPSGPALECRLPPPALWKAGQTQRFTAVAGVTPAGQRRRGFLYYLERERPRPYAPLLHYNSWYDIAWVDRKMTEAQCLEVVAAFGRELVERRGVQLDSFVFDDGWDDNRTLWRFHAGFPRGFTPIREAAAAYGSGIGVWLSPWGGYATAKKERLEYGRTQGFETKANGFSLAGPQYYARFRETCLEMVDRYGVNYFKFDGLAKGDSQKGAGKEYAADVDSMLRLVDDLRRARPDLFINITTGTWPSPFWLLWCDSVWRNGNDMGFAGAGSKRQQWISYRDAIVRKKVVGPGPLFPIGSLMTQGIAQARLGHAAELGADLKEWKDEVRSFFASGVQLQELYVTPSLLTPAMWDSLAEAARWSRGRAATLADVHWIGGDPAAGEVYGFAAWSAARATLCLRNPGPAPRDYAVDVAAAFELPAGAATRYRCVEAFAEPAAAPWVLRAGQPTTFRLRPFEVLVLDAVPDGNP